MNTRLRRAYFDCRWFVLDHTVRSSGANWVRPISTLTRFRIFAEATTQGGRQEPAQG